MPKYRIELLDRKTRRQLDRIHEPDLSRIAEAILRLEETTHVHRDVANCVGWKAGASASVIGV